MLMYLILAAVLLLAVAELIFSFNRSGKIVEGLYDLIRNVRYMEQEMDGMKASLRAIAETTVETAEVVEQMRKEKEAAELPDEEAARRAKEEIDRFNTGIANILSFGTDEKDGGKK